MGHARAQAPKPATLSASTQLTTSSARDDPVPGYKIRALLYDLRNLANDSSSERRLNATTDEHYISAPYFPQEEAALIKTALVDVGLDGWLDHSTADYTEDLNAPSLSSRLQNQSVDAAIRIMLGNFLEKRRASGDFPTLWSAPSGTNIRGSFWVGHGGIEGRQILESPQTDRDLTRWHCAIGQFPCRWVLHYEAGQTEGLPRPGSDMMRPLSYFLLYGVGDSSGTLLSGMPGE
ncbi:hypothetical protein LZ31DRAFT_242815 [Colletotrichum somersetense]|nr:hypothetical protein LZ31DRAFT_242815 [Colletotrichum somersetense]